MSQSFGSRLESRPSAPAAYRPVAGSAVQLTAVDIPFGDLFRFLLKFLVAWLCACFVVGIVLGILYLVLRGIFES